MHSTLGFLGQDVVSLSKNKKISGSSFFVTTAGCNLQDASVIERHFHPSTLEKLKNKLYFLNSSVS